MAPAFLSGRLRAFALGSVWFWREFLTKGKAWFQPRAVAGCRVWPAASPNLSAIQEGEPAPGHPDLIGLVRPIAARGGGAKRHGPAAD